MLTFWINLTVARINGGMDREEAIAKVPAKYREAVREAIKNEAGNES